MSLAGSTSLRSFGVSCERQELDRGDAEARRGSRRCAAAPAYVPAHAASPDRLGEAAQVDLVDDVVAQRPVGARAGIAGVVVQHDALALRWAA